MDKPCVLIGLERGQMDILTLYRALNHAFGMNYSPSECASGAEVVGRAVYGYHFGCPFDLMIVSHFGHSTERVLHGELSFRETVGMIRVLRKYQHSPIVVVSYNCYEYTYRGFGVRAWVSPHASEEELEIAICAVMGRQYNKEREKSSRHVRVFEYK